MNLKILQSEFEDLDMSKLDETHPLKSVNIDEIIPINFTMESIVSLNNRNVFLFYFIKHLSSERSFFKKLDQDIMLMAFQGLFIFLAENPEFIDCFEIVQDQQ